MSEGEDGTPATAGQVVTRPAGLPSRGAEQEPGFAQRHSVLLVALLLIVVQLVWKAYLLHGLYFRVDDFHDLDLAIEHPLNWSYLTYIWAGHLIIGLRIVAWLMVRTSLYNWGLASFISLAFTAAADLACYRVLRLLFGEAPRILIPLTFYLLTPLTITDLGWWSSAMEAVPLQLAIFMMLASHLQYVRTGRGKYLAWATFWFAFGLVFFEKALVLPALLFVITAAFLVERRTLADGVLTTLKRFWRAWAIYLALAICYVVIFLIALQTSISQPQAPPSLGSVLTLMGDLLKNSFFPGVFGGPWQWYPLPGNSFAIAGPPQFLAWVSVVLGLVVMAATIIMRRRAWLAWLTLAIWLFAADLLPLLLGRISTIPAALLGLDIRYVADAAAIVAICIGLAIWPVIGAPTARRRGATATVTAPGPQPLRMAVMALAGLFVVGSIWSVQDLKTTISGASARSYLANATEAIHLAPRGTLVYDWPVPSDIVPAVFGQYSQASKVIGDLDIGKLRWVRNLDGTVDNLYWFGTDGELRPVWVGPTSSLRRTKAQGCWPIRHGQIVVSFPTATSPYTWILRIGYLLGSTQPVAVNVTYGTSVKTVTLLPGLHAAFVSVGGGRVGSITLSGLGTTPMCLGDVEAGSIESSPFSKAIP
jgi:hypothetical protein